MTGAALIPAHCPLKTKSWDFSNPGTRFWRPPLLSWISLLLSCLLVLSQTEIILFWMDPCIRLQLLLFYPLYVSWLALGSLRACRVHCKEGSSTSLLIDDTRLIAGWPFGFHAWIKYVYKMILLTAPCIILLASRPLHSVGWKGRAKRQQSCCLSSVSKRFLVWTICDSCVLSFSFEGNKERNFALYVREEYN